MKFIIDMVRKAVKHLPERYRGDLFDRVFDGSVSLAHLGFVSLWYITTPDGKTKAFADIHIGMVAARRGAWEKREEVFRDWVAKASSDDLLRTRDQLQKQTSLFLMDRELELKIQAELDLRAAIYSTPLRSVGYARFG